MPSSTQTTLPRSARAPLIAASLLMLGLVAATTGPAIAESLALFDFLAQVAKLIAPAARAVAAAGVTLVGHHVVSFAVLSVLLVSLAGHYWISRKALALLVHPDPLPPDAWMDGVRLAVRHSYLEKTTRVLGFALTTIVGIALLIGGITGPIEVSQSGAMPGYLVLCLILVVVVLCNAPWVRLPEFENGGAGGTFRAQRALEKEDRIFWGTPSNKDLDERVKLSVFEMSVVLLYLLNERVMSNKHAAPRDNTANS